MAIFFTGDLHYGHANIIRYCSRPFADVEAMNAALVAGWNATIAEGDDVYFLGDMCFFKGGKVPITRLLCELKGRIHWIKGNHDPSLTRLQEIQYLLPERIVWVGQNLVLEYLGEHYFLTHRPMDSSPSMPTICGHVHEKWRALDRGTIMHEYRSEREVTLKQPALNAGVDAWGFKPVGIEEALSVLKHGPYSKQASPIIE